MAHLITILGSKEELQDELGALEALESWKALDDPEIQKEIKQYQRDHKIPGESEDSTSSDSSDDEGTAAKNKQKNIQKPVAEKDIYTIQYVLIDVPYDGSCQMSSFHLGQLAATVHWDLYKSNEAGIYTTQDIEGMVKQALENGAPAHDMSLAEIYNQQNLHLRHTIVQYWNDHLGDFAQEIKADIRDLLVEVLKEQGLLQRAAAASEQKNTTKPSTPATSLTLPASQPQPLPASAGPLSVSISDDEDWQIEEDSEPEDDVIYDWRLPDEDFIFNALFYPESWRTFHPHQEGQSSAKKSFGVRLEALKTMHLPMGVVADGELANAIRALLVGLITHQQQGNLIPLHTIQAPTINDIDDALINAYKNEFAVNLGLWGGVASLKALAASQQTTVVTHAFDQNNERIERDIVADGTNGPVNIYMQGSQNHFQVLVGPFGEGFLAEEVEEEDLPSLGEDIDMLLADIDEDDNDTLLSPSSPIISTPTSMSDQDFLTALAQKMKVPKPTSALEMLFRAASCVADQPVNTVDKALLCIQKYQTLESDREKKATSGRRNYQRLLVPMAGFVVALWQEYNIPLQEIFKLLPHTQKYVAFHKKHTSWKSLQAEHRAAELRDIAQILNEWAEIYKCPALKRGPSIAEFAALPRSTDDKRCGKEMRALLTINPGKLLGYEPASYMEWETFNEVLPGYVRAHLLNKHVGGPGLPYNLAFLSSKDNTTMSALGEEDVTRLVLENNMLVFYQVIMVTGMDIIHQATTMSKFLTNQMVREVHMYATEVFPDNQTDTPPFKLGEDLLRALYAKKEQVSTTLCTRGIVLQTIAPDTETIGKVQAHWQKRITNLNSTAETLSLDALFHLSPDILAMERKAQIELQTADSAQADKIIIALKKQLAEQERPEEEIKEIEVRLWASWRTKATTDNAKKRKRSKSINADPKRRKKAMALFKEKKILSTEQDFVDITDANLTDGQFEKYLELRVNGAEHARALKLCQTNTGKRFKRLSTEIKQSARGFGIESFFKKKEEDEEKKAKK